jgi:hypothetical protein
VQWHPELLRHRSEHLALFEALVAAGAASTTGLGRLSRLGIPIHAAREQ